VGRGGDQMKLREGLLTTKRTSEKSPGEKRLWDLSQKKTIGSKDLKGTMTLIQKTLGRV